MLLTRLSKKLMLFVLAGLTISIHTFYAMEDNREDSNSGDYIALQEYKLEDNENLLQKIYSFMPELLQMIMDYLPVDDPGYNYLKLYGHFDITKDQAERAIEIFYRRLLLFSKNFNEFNAVTKRKRKTLDKSFPNYEVLNNAYNKLVIDRRDNLHADSSKIASSLRLSIQQQNWIQFSQDLDTFVDNQKEALSDVNKQEKLLGLKKILFTIQIIKQLLKKDPLNKKFAFNSVISIFPCLLICLAPTIAIIVIFYLYGILNKIYIAIPIFAAYLCVISLTITGQLPNFQNLITLIGQSIMKLDNIIKDISGQIREEALEV